MSSITRSDVKKFVDLSEMILSDFSFFTDKLEYCSAFNNSMAANECSLFSSERFCYVCGTFVEKKKAHTEHFVKLYQFRHKTSKSGQKVSHPFHNMSCVEQLRK